MKKSLLILPIIASLFLLWCGNANPNANCTTGNVCPLPTTGSQQIQQTSLTWVAQQTILAIKTQDFATLSTLASTNGVRFSAYENVNTWNDIVLTVQQIATAGATSWAYNRWSYDGSGQPITLSIGQYRAKFVYDTDFASAPVQQWNQVTQRGNVINNITSAYAGKQVIEYHVTGIDPQYNGMDWKSLYLIFDQENGVWKLIWVVHGQRTI